MRASAIASRPTRRSPHPLPAARYGTMCIAWPKDVAVAWARSEQVGLAASCAIPDGTLQLVVEKDFACLAPRAGSEDVDTFPHPRAGS